MDQYMEILTYILQNQRAKIEVTFPGLTFSADALVESAALRTLAQIQKILQDDTLNDQECFYKIEAIVHTLEQAGLGCGGRHDFG